MKRRFFSALLAALPTLTQIAPAIAQTTAAATLDPNTEVSLPGLYYDPDAPSSTFSQLPGAEQAGYVDVPALPPGVKTPYLLDRAWPQGATPDQILKFGDLQQNPVTASFTKLSVRQLTASSGTNIGDVPVGDVALLNGLTIGQVDDLYTKINNGEKIKLKDAAPAVQAAFGVLLNPGSAPQQLQNAALTVGERVALEKLSKIPALEGIPLQDLARGNWEGVIDKADQIKLAGIGEKIGPTLKKLPVKQIVPIVGDAVAGDWRDARRKAIALAQQKGTEVAVKELLKEFPQLKNVPIAAIPGVLNQPVDQALPQVADLAIEYIPGAKDRTINSVPGLEDIPINELPFDLAFSFFAGDVFARFDIAYSGVDGPEEPSVNHALSGGSEDQKFKPIKCTVGESEKQRADNCPHFEMRKFIDSVAETAGLDSDIEGKQWVQGDSGGKNGQGVKGGKGLLKWVNGGWEPAGIHPFGVNSHTKFVLKKITEYPDKKSTARLSLAFQFCVTIPLLGQQCTPHFLVIPTPFVIKEDGLFLVASRRNLPAEIARLRHQTLTAGVYCDPDQIIATAGQSDSGASDTKQGDISDLQAQAEAEGVDLQPIDGSTGAPRLDGIPGQPRADAATSTFASASGQSTRTQGTKAQTVGTSAWGSETDVYNLILTSALESTGTQNQVDVAVAIMNRVVSPKHPNTITDVVFQPKQYEPNFGQAPVTSKEEAISRIARKTRSIQSAISTYETIEQALNDPNQIAASQAFLKGATDFRGQDWLHIRKSGDPYRGNVGANFYFQESQDPAIAAATLGVLGVESTAVDPNSIHSSASDHSIPCKPSAIASAGFANISNGNFEQGSGVASGKLDDPLADQQYKVTSNFGYRTDPVYGVTSFHYGIDLAWDTGTPIKAADGGEVVMSKWNGEYGNFILIDHGNGLATWYAHNSVNYVKVGDKVDPGQVIGEVGSTGKSTGPHLDFGVVEGYQKGNIYSGQPVNPRKHVNFPSLRSYNQPF